MSVEANGSAISIQIAPTIQQIKYWITNLIKLQLNRQALCIFMIPSLRTFLVSDLLLVEWSLVK